MAALQEIKGMEEYIQHSVAFLGKTYSQVSADLQQQLPGMRGFSSRSIARFCTIKDIKATSRLSKEELGRVVQSAISEVGPVYGRKTMQGYLSFNGIKAGQRQIGEVLPLSGPQHYHAARQNATSQHLNPHPYVADYFGHKLHVDQNEKIGMFGVTHIAAIDGFSNMVVGFVSMPVKNNIEIYKEMFFSVLATYGLWDQIRVDHGKEWVLMLYVQELLADLRTNVHRAPHLQSSSKQNHMVERFWVEVNSRVNYPIKNVLIAMEARDEISFECPMHKYCMSWFTLRVANVGCSIAVGAWNNHTIPTKGIPIRRMNNNNCAARISADQIPSVESAVARFKGAGGSLTLFPTFGEDPLSENGELKQIRHEEFTRLYPDFSIIFHALVNGNKDIFTDGLKYYISLTDRLSFSV